ncbi:MAG: hypothetical protein ACLQDY_08920 [Streptosporangiaceae bacterium]|jgi:hypothetical protein
MTAGQAIRWSIRGSVVVPETGIPVSGPVTGPDTAGNGLPAHLVEAQRRYAAELAAGQAPPIRRIRSDLGIGQAKATEVQAHLSALTSSP